MNRGAGVAILLVGVAVGCGPSRQATRVVVGLGGVCAGDGDCREPLVCAGTVCTPSHAVGLGGACVLSADCVAGLYCARGACAPAGTGMVGTPCGSVADCQSELYCGLVGFGATCQPGGNNDLGRACDTAGDCVAPLLCDPVEGECASVLPPPAGVSCCSQSACFDSLCAPAYGIVCLQDGTCGGLGPDRQPIPPWAGVSCPAPGGSFQVVFDVGTISNDFFRLPFPNDIRRDSDGTVSLAGFPRSPAPHVPTDFVGSYVEAIEAEQNGFGPNQSVFLRFSDRPRFCVAGCNATANCAQGCLGTGEPAPSFYLVDVTAGSYQFTPINYRWFASSGSTPYICGPYLALAPAAATPWVPDHTYAVFVHSRILGASGQAMVQSADFAAMLASTAPAEARLSAAYPAYAPLRVWLASAPPYPAGDPNAGTPVVAADLGGAAVFTVRNPTTTVVALGNVIEARADPGVSAVVACTGAPPPATCANVAGASFTEAQGLLALPIFQEGTAPYFNQGGGIAVDGAGVPQEQRTENIRFALSVPPGGMPASGWPVVIYAHGTGGDYQSHLRDGVAQAFATAGAAVLAIDQPLHGLRAGGSSLPPDLLFSNFANPRAARGNVLQAAADQMALARAVGVIGAAVAANPDFAGLMLDASRVTFLGHSQGGITGALAMARSKAVKTVVLSGAGAGLIDSLMNKASPYDLPTIMRWVLADPNLNDGQMHPALSLVQGYLEDADPMNYGRLLAYAPPAGVPAKHVLMVVGEGDTFTPNLTAVTLASRVGPSFALVGNGLYVDGDNVNLGVPEATAPVQANLRNAANEMLTVAVTVHAPAPGNDGHFVLFDDAKALERVVKFISTWNAAPASAPVVVP